MSAQPVDVLAVLERDAAHADAYRSKFGVYDSTPAALRAESEAAAAAVRELIAAVRLMLDGPTGTRHVAERELRAALAACGGAK